MIKIGDKILVKNNYSGHNYNIGNYYIICGIKGNSFSAYDPITNFQGNNINFEDFEVISKIGSDELNEKKKKLNYNLKKLKFILNFIENQNLESCDEFEINSLYLISLFESNEPDKKDELAKILNKLSNKIKIDFIKYN